MSSTDLAKLLGIDSANDGTTSMTFTANKIGSSPPKTIPVVSIGLHNEHCQIDICDSQEDDQQSSDLWLEANWLLQAWAQALSSPYMGRLIPVTITWRDGTALALEYPLTIVDGRFGGASLVNMLLTILPYYAGRETLHDLSRDHMVNWEDYFGVVSPVEQGLARRILEGPYVLLGGTRFEDMEKKLNPLLPPPTRWTVSDNLTTTVLNRLFQSVYGMQPITEKFLAQHPHWDLTFQALLARQGELYAEDRDWTDLYDMVDPVLGPLDLSPSGARLWLCLCAALQEMYFLSDGDLVTVLSRVTYRQAPSRLESGLFGADKSDD